MSRTAVSVFVRRPAFCFLLAVGRRAGQALDHENRKTPISKPAANAQRPNVQAEITRTRLRRSSVRRPSGLFLFQSIDPDHPGPRAVMRLRYPAIINRRIRSGTDAETGGRHVAGRGCIDIGGAPARRRDNSERGRRTDARAPRLLGDPRIETQPLRQSPNSASLRSRSR